MKTNRQFGFTLVEMIVTILVTSVVVTMVSMFIKKPIDAYVDVSNRAELTDIADTALRRIARDLHTAVPNSLRQPANNCIIFLPTVTGGRYRANVDNSGSGNAVDFTQAIQQFDVIGSMPAIPSAGDHVVIYNLGVMGDDAYNGDNMATIRNASATTIQLVGTKLFPFSSPSNRFHVVPDSDQAVSYVYDGAAQTLYRVSHFGFSTAACPSTTAAGSTVLAQNVTAATFAYTQNTYQVNQRDGLLAMQLAISTNNETVSLYHEVHIDNAP
jgi:MSHA biogenesis protein MshO